MIVNVAVIVLNYLRYKDTIDCVKAIINSDVPGEIQIICVDNSPDNVSEREIKKHLPGVHLIKSPKNLGFAAGNNLGINYALEHKASHILIINPDVLVDKIFLKPLLAILDGKSKVGLVAPAIRHYQNNLLFYGLEGWVDWRFATAKHINLESLKKKTIRPAQFVSFACVLIDAKVIREIGLLDEGFFMYLEDVDYCLMAERAGYKILVNPQVQVNHQTSSSFKKPTDKLKISFFSQVRFVNKWLSFPKNIFPLLYAICFYPYLYVLWTYFDIKKKLLQYS